MTTPLEAARAALEERRRIEASLVRYECPVCQRGCWVPPGTVGWCQVHDRRLKRVD